MTLRGTIAAVLISTMGLTAGAWERGRVRTLAVLPPGAAGPEGLEVDGNGTLYVGSFGFNAAGEVSGPAHIYVFDARGRFLRNLALANASPHILGLKLHPRTGKLLVADFGGGQVLSVDPRTGVSTVFMTLPATLPHPGGSGLNDITFDRAGNVYVSDSSQGIIWKAPSTGGLATAWIDADLLRTTGVPPFGANGLRFDRDESTLYVANTGNDTVVVVPVEDGAPGTPAIFAQGVNGADGLLVDRHGNLWVAANQGDEIVVLDPGGQVIAKLGDFDGEVHRGQPEGLLFPASIRFSGDRLIVTNLALDLRIFSPDFVAVDSDWAAQVSRYTVSEIDLDFEHRH